MHIDYKAALFKIITDRPDLKMHIMHIFLSAGTTMDNSEQDNSFMIDWDVIYTEVMKVAHELDSKS